MGLSESELQHSDEGGREFGLTNARQAGVSSEFITQACYLAINQ